MQEFTKQYGYNTSMLGITDLSKIKEEELIVREV